MKKLVLSRGITFALLLFPLLSFTGCYSTVEVGDSSADKAIAIDWVEPPCAEPGSAAGYIEGNGFGAKNVTITVGGIEAQVLAATGKDASFVVPEGLPPGPIEVVVMNPGGRLATINWVVCGFDCNAIDCDDGNECTTDTCDPVVEMCVHTPVGDGVACDFGGLPGLCVAGVCEEDASCPVLTSVLATPPQANVGDQINVTAEASGVGPINYLWTATGGSFVDPSLPTTAYLCEEAGQQDLTITISDGTGSCTDANTVAVTCLGGGDTDPPVLVDFDFNPKSVDVSVQDQVVTCSPTVFDAGVGVESVVCQFDSPTGQQVNASCTLPPFPSGLIDCDATIPQGAESATWTLTQVRLWDAVGNRRDYRTAELQTLGFPTDLSVTSSGGGDTDPPELIDFDFNPKSVDVSVQDQVVTCSPTVFDAGVGVESVVCQFDSPTGQQVNASCTLPPFPSGLIDCDATIPQGAESATWTLTQVRLWDAVGNRRDYRTAELQTLGFPTDLSVTSSGGGDTDPPELIDFDFNPKSVDVSVQDQVVTCSPTVFDAGVGVESVVCQFDSPTGQQVNASCTLPPFPSGLIDCDATIPQGAESATWTLTQVRLWDAVGNRRDYRTAELQTLGFPTDLSVTSSGGGDTDPPELIDFDFNPKQVDVSSGAQNVTCTMDVTDSPSGVDHVTCRFRSPSGQQEHGCFSSSPDLGDAFNGTWPCIVTIPQNAEDGAWELLYVTSRDTIGNSFEFDTQEMQALGYPTALDVSASSPDVDPPELIDFDFNPKQVDVSSGAQNVTCTMDVTDSPSGVDHVTCRFRSPSGQQEHGCFSSSPDLGDAFNGTWPCIVTIPQNAEDGAWELLYVTSRDTIGNSFEFDTQEMQALGYPTALDVSASSPDVDPPELIDFDFNPKQVDVSSGAQNVTCTMDVTDSPSGVDHVTCRFRSPSGQQEHGCFSSSPDLGDAFNGTWPCIVTIPQNAEDGAWELLYVTSRDTIGNSFEFDTQEMQALGYPTALDVTYGP